MQVKLNEWYCCHFPIRNAFELCKVMKRLIKGPDNRLRYEYFIITFYDRREVFSGTRKDCFSFIENNWVERRYLDE